MTRTAEFLPPFSGEVLCAPDSFKGTLSAGDAAAALAAGVHQVWPGAPTRLLPLADGGEGSLAVLHRAAGGVLRAVRVQGPLGELVDALYLWLEPGVAVIEMAQAAGLLLVPPERRDAEAASTYGVGQLIRAALDAGALKIIVCLGGSATTDGGAGMADALGFRLLDAMGQTLALGGGNLSHLDQIDRSGADPRLASIAILAATDVNNPLCGSRGAAAVYGPQKGATPGQVRRLDEGLARLAAVLYRECGLDILDLPGAGAAGGLGGGLVGFLKASIESGAETLMDAAGVPAALQKASLCLTGEGYIDSQSSQGKLIQRLARRCQQASVPLIAIGGGVAAGAQLLADAGVAALMSATMEPGPPPDSTEVAAARLRDAAATVCRLLALGAVISKQ